MTEARKRVLSMVVAAAVVGGGIAAVAGVSYAKKTTPTTLRVMTWNIGQEGNGTYSKGFGSVVGNQKPDILGLQEVCSGTTKSLIADLKERYKLDYDPVYALHEPNGPLCHETGNVLLVRKNGATKLKITKSGTAKYAAQAKKGQIRGYAWANVSTPGGVVTAASTHLENGQEDKGKEASRDAYAKRAEQVAELAKGFRNGANTSLAMGDFNLGPGAKELKPIYDGLKMRDVDPHCYPKQSASCKGTSETGSKIDFIFQRGFTVPSGAEVHATPSSDHKVLVANLRIG